MGWSGLNLFGPFFFVLDCANGHKVHFWVQFSDFLADLIEGVLIRVVREHLEYLFDFQITFFEALLL